MNRVSELRLICRRKAGAMLKANAGKRGRPKKGEDKKGSHEEPISIPKVEVHKLQRESSVPEPVFRKYVSETAKAGKMSRRNLTDDQRACVAAEIAERMAAQTKRERAAKGTPAREARRNGDTLEATSATKVKADKRSRTKSADAVKVSEKRVRRAMTLKKAAPKKFQAVQQGEMSLKEAEREVHNAKREAEKQEKVRAAAKVAPDSEEGVRVGDFRSVCEDLNADSVDLILTDPPYAVGNTADYIDLAKHAARILKPGGSLLAYSGQIDMPRRLAGMAEHLRYWWVVCCPHGGTCSRMTEYGIVVGWKPIFWFVKGTRRDKHSFLNDIVTGKREKEHHDWQQAECEAAELIEKLTDPGDVVFDPFCGSGTTAVAAKRNDNGSAKAAPPLKDRANKSAVKSAAAVKVSEKRVRRAMRTMRRIAGRITASTPPRCGFTVRRSVDHAPRFVRPV